MAIRRCFSKKIVRSDDFLDLPATTQLLYFQLGMEADDRGYVNNARSVVKITGCVVGDLEMLIAKKFVLLRDDKLILIKDWRINNTIQPTRISESLYVDDLKKLFFDEHGSYTEKDTSNPVLEISCRQNDDKLLTQDNIREENLIEDNLTKDNPIKENDITRLNEIKANPLAKELTKKLIACGYITISDLQLCDYINYFESLFNEGRDLIDIKVKLDYFIRNVCHYKMTGELDYSEKPTFARVYENDRSIQDPYVYFVSSMDRAFDRDDIASDDTNSTNHNLATTEVVNSNSIDDDLPF